MLLRPSDTFFIEFHVQHGLSRNDGMDKTLKFHAVRPGYAPYLHDCE